MEGIAGGVAGGEEKGVGWLELASRNEEVNVGHGAEAEVWIHQGGEVRAFQDGDFDAGGLQRGEDLGEIVVNQGVAGGSLEEGLLEGGENGRRNFDHEATRRTRMGGEGRGMGRRRRGGRRRDVRATQAKGLRRGRLRDFRRRGVCATRAGRDASAIKEGLAREGPIEEGGQTVARGRCDNALPVGLGEVGRRRIATQEAEEDVSGAGHGLHGRNGKGFNHE